MNSNNILVRGVEAVKNFFVWYLQRLIPRNKNRWIFGAWFGERYSDNSRSIYEYVLNNHPEIDALWVTKNEDVYNRLKAENKPVAMLSSSEAKRHAVTSKVAFITVADKEVNGLYLNGAKLVWLWHGMPMKYIEADERRFVEGDRFDHPTLLRRIKMLYHPYLKKHVDCVLTTGEFFNPIFESSFQVGPEKVWNDGYPRNDELFSKEQDAIVAQYREHYPNAKFIIYMPTHRLHGLSGKPFSPFEGNGFEPEKLFKLLEEKDYVFFYKGHFYDSGASVKLSHPRFVDVTHSSMDVLYRFVKDMDILITDYSSIYFDYLLLKKPIVLTPFDYEEYIKSERPLYFDYFSLEAPKANNWDELIAILEGDLKDPSDEEVSKYLSHTDGNSSERIFNHIQKSFL